MLSTREYFLKHYDYFDKNLATECGNCLSKKNLCIHHIMPLSIGGTNRISNMVRLCEDCHYKVHGKNINMNALAKKSIEKARLNGVQFGRKRTNEDTYKQAITEHLKGTSLNDLKVKYPFLKDATFYRRLREYRMSKGQVVKTGKRHIKRKEKLPKDYDLAIQKYLNDEGTVKQVINQFYGMSEATFYRRLKIWRHRMEQSENIKE